MSAEQALQAMAAAERDSEHMLSRAIVNAASERNLSLPEATEFRAIPGRGVEARVDGQIINVGGPRLLEGMQIEVPEELHEHTQKAGSAGQTLVYLVQDGRVLAAVALADVIRPESREAVSELGQLGVRVAMMTGDSDDVARWVADQLGITEYYASVLPEDKARRVQEIRKQGRRVAMVGDGVNDAPALVSADVGIAIGAGTDVAIEAGGIVLVKNDPRDVVNIIRLSRATYRKMVENLIWATGYNVVAIPLAGGVLAGYGIILPPAVGAVFMSVSTMVVALNAQLLRRLDLRSSI
jgi:Cu2+-exporting ATPase